MLHQIVTETPMAVNPPPRRRGDYLPETAASIAAAKAACELERQRLRDVTGILIAEDGTVSLPITDEGIALQQRVDCAAAVAVLVDRFGLSVVLRAVRLEAEAGR